MLLNVRFASIILLSIPSVRFPCSFLLLEKHSSMFSLIQEVQLRRMQKTKNKLKVLARNTVLNLRYRERRTAVQLPVRNQMLASSDGCFQQKVKSDKGVYQKNEVHLLCFFFSLKEYFSKYFFLLRSLKIDISKYHIHIRKKKKMMYSQLFKERNTLPVILQTHYIQKNNWMFYSGIFLLV